MTSIQPPQKAVKEKDGGKKKGNAPQAKRTDLDGKPSWLTPSSVVHGPQKQRIDNRGSIPSWQTAPAVLPSWKKEKGSGELPWFDEEKVDTNLPWQVELTPGEKPVPTWQDAPKELKPWQMNEKYQNKYSKKVSEFKERDDNEDNKEVHKEEENKQGVYYQKRIKETADSDAVWGTKIRNTTDNYNEQAYVPSTSRKGRKKHSDIKSEGYVLGILKKHFFTLFFDDPVVAAAPCMDIRAEDIFPILSAAIKDEAALQSPSLNSNLLKICRALSLNKAMRDDFVNASPHCVELIALWEHADKALAAASVNPVTRVMVEAVVSKTMMAIAIIISYSPASISGILPKVYFRMKDFMNYVTDPHSSLRLLVILMITIVKFHAAEVDPICSAIGAHKKDCDIGKIRTYTWFSFVNKIIKAATPEVLFKIIDSKILSRNIIAICHTKNIEVARACLVKNLMIINEKIIFKESILRMTKATIFSVACLETIGQFAYFKSRKEKQMEPILQQLSYIFIDSSTAISNEGSRWSWQNLDRKPHRANTGAAAFVRKLKCKNGTIQEFVFSLLKRCPDIVADYVAHAAAFLRANIAQTEGMSLDWLSVCSSLISLLSVDSLPPIVPRDSSLAGSISHISAPACRPSDLARIVYPVNETILQYFIRAFSPDMLSTFTMMRMAIVLLRRVKHVVDIIRARIAFVQTQHGAGAFKALTEWQVFYEELVSEIKKTMLPSKAINTCMLECQKIIKGGQLEPALAKKFASSAAAFDAYSMLYHHLLVYASETCDVFPEEIPLMVISVDQLNATNLNPLCVYQTGKLVDKIVAGDLMPKFVVRSMLRLQGQIGAPNTAHIMKTTGRLVTDICANNRDEADVWVSQIDLQSLEFATVFITKATLPTYYLNLMEQALAGKEEIEENEKLTIDQTDFTPLVLGCLHMYNKRFHSVALERRESTYDKKEKKKLELDRVRAEMQQTGKQERYGRRMERMENKIKDEMMADNASGMVQMEELGARTYIMGVLTTVASCIRTGRVFRTLIARVLNGSAFNTRADLSFISSLLSFSLCVEGQFDGAKKMEKTPTRTEAFKQTLVHIGHGNRLETMKHLFMLSPYEFNKLLKKTIILFKSMGMGLLVKYFFMHPEYPVWSYGFIRKQIDNDIEQMDLLHVIPLTLLLSHAFFPSEEEGKIYLDDPKIQECLYSLLNGSDAAQGIRLAKLILNQLYRFVPENGKTETEEDKERSASIMDFSLKCLHKITQTCCPPNEDVKDRVQFELLAHPAFRALFLTEALGDKIVGLLYFVLSTKKQEPSHPSISFYLDNILSVVKSALRSKELSNLSELKHFSTLIPFYPASTIDDVLSILLSVPHNLLVEDEHPCRNLLEAILSYGSKANLDYSHPLFKKLFSVPKANEINDTKYSLPAAAVGSLLKILMEHESDFLGEYLVHAFLKDASSEESDFVPHVPEGFTASCLSNPTEYACQILSVLFAVSSQHREEFAKLISSFSESDNKRFEFEVSKDRADDPVTFLIFPIFTYISILTSNQSTTKQDQLAMRSISEVCFPLILPHVIYPSTQTTTFYEKKSNYVKFPFHELIASLVRFCETNSILSSTFCSQFLSEYLDVSRTFYLDDFYLASSVVDVLLQKEAEEEGKQRERGKRTKRETELHLFVAKLVGNFIKENTKEGSFPPSFMDQYVQLTSVLVDSKCKDVVARGLIEVFESPQFVRFVEITSVLQNHPAIALLDFFIQSVPSLQWKEKREIVQSIFLKVSNSDNFLSVLHTPANSKNEWLLHRKLSLVYLLHSLHVHAGVYLLDQIYFVKLQGGYFGTMHITDQIILDIFQQHQTKANFGFANTCFLWGAAASETLTNKAAMKPKTPEKTLSIGTIIDADMLQLSLDSKLPNKKFGAAFKRGPSPLLNLGPHNSIFKITMSNEPVVYDPTFLLPFFEAAITPATITQTINTSGINYVVRALASKDDILKRLAVSALTKFIQKSSTKQDRAVETPLLALRMTYKSFDDIFLPMHTEFISRAIKILQNKFDPMHGHINEFFFRSPKLSGDIPLWELFNTVSKRPPANEFLLDYLISIVSAKSEDVFFREKVYESLMRFYTFSTYNVAAHAKVLTFFADSMVNLSIQMIDQHGLLAWLASCVQSHPVLTHSHLPQIIKICSGFRRGSRTQHYAIVLVLLSNYYIPTAKNEDIATFFMPLLRHICLLSDPEPLLSIADLSLLVSIHQPLSAQSTREEKMQMIEYMVKIICLTIENYVEAYLSRESLQTVVTLLVWCQTSLGEFAKMELKHTYVQLWRLYSKILKKVSEVDNILPIMLENSRFVSLQVSSYGMRDLLGLNNEVILSVNIFLVRVLGYLKSLQPEQRDNSFYGKRYNTATKDKAFAKFEKKFPEFLKNRVDDSPASQDILSSVLRFVFAGAPVEKILTLMK